MMTKEQIETLLKINGVDDTCSDEDIRAVLLSARYSPTEAESAIAVLRQNIDTNNMRVDGLHKVFYSDGHLKPAEVSSLLGVDINIMQPLDAHKQALSRELTFVQMLVIVCIASVIGLAGIMYYMYTENIGFFHPTSVAFKHQDI